MPSLHSAKHTIGEISGTRCTVIETDAPEERVKFLKELLEYNKFEVVTAENPAEDSGRKTYTVGVTDILFHPVIAVYERALLAPNGKPVTRGYWLQQTDRIDRRYWRRPQ